MKTVSKRELNQQTATVLADVSAGEDIVITERGRPQWKITKFRHEETPLERLERLGLYTPASADPPPWPETPGGPEYTEDEFETLLDEMRSDH